MPILSPSAETSNNKEALEGTGIPADGSGTRGAREIERELPSVDGLGLIGGSNANGFDVGASPGGESASSYSQELSTLVPDSGEWLGIMNGCKKTAEDYLNRMTPRWEQAYRAVANQHTGDSKYASPRWRGRSKLFRPKTRSSLHKADANAANSLFSSPDIVNTTAMNPGDESQAASAAIMKELLNYRLDRQSGKSGVPWFQLSVGAHQDARITGICVSKQYWEYVPDTSKPDLSAIISAVLPGMGAVGGMPPMAPPSPGLAGPPMDAMGGPSPESPFGQTPLPDGGLGGGGVPAMGAPVPDMGMSSGPMAPPASPMGMALGSPMAPPPPKLKRDRPMIRVYPPELVWRDPTSYWVNQVESSSFIALLHPIPVGDAVQMMKAGNSKSVVKWLPLTKAQLSACRTLRQASTTPMSNARDTNNPDRYEQQNSFDDFNICWMIEWFCRRDGQEWHWWSAGMQYLASVPAPVEDVYPHMKGERPLVIGYGALEPHKIDPMSRVADTLPLQQEINDLANLTLDGVKETVRPITVIKRGKNIDLNAIQNRGGDAVALVEDVDKDIRFNQPGTINPAAFEQQERLSVDFDDASGQFNAGSVQTNRNLNETVGGMKMITSAANVVGDFDIRIWIETWVEPVLRQVVLLEQFYEDNPTILAIAGEKAQLWKKFGVSQIDDDLLTREIYVNVSAGMGAADPSIKFEKIGRAAQLTGIVLGPTAQQRIKQDPLIDEIWGTAGYKNASEAFFHPGDNQDQRITQMQDALQQLSGQLEDKQADRDNKVQQVRLQGSIDLLKQLLQNMQAQQNAQMQHEQAMEQQRNAQGHDMTKTLVTGAQKAIDTDKKGQQQSALADKKGDQAIAVAKEKGAQSVATVNAKEGKTPPPAPDDNAVDPRQMDMLMQMIMMQMMGAPIPGADGPQPPSAPPGGQAPMGMPPDQGMPPQGAPGMPPGMPMPGQPPGPDQSAPLGPAMGAAPQPDPTTAVVQQMQQQNMAVMALLQQVGQAVAQMGQSLDAQAQAARMPKRVVRGPDGKVQGIVPGNPEVPDVMPPPMPGPPAQDLPPLGDIAGMPPPPQGVPPLPMGG